MTRLSLTLSMLGSLLFVTSLQAAVTISDPWARSTFKFAANGAAYLTLHNHSEKAVKLVGATVSSDVAVKVEFHETLMEGEVAKMRPLKMPIEFASHQKVAFVPGGKHIMLLGLNGPLNSGESFDLTLMFDSGEEQKVTVDIREGAKSDDSAGHHHHH